MRPQAQLGISDRVGMAGLPGDEPRETFSSSLDKVEPGVLTEGGVGVSFAGSRDELGDRGQVVVIEVALNLDVVHCPEASLDDSAGTTW